MFFETKRTELNSRPIAKDCIGGLVFGFRSLVLGLREFRLEAQQTGSATEPRALTNAT